MTDARLAELVDRLDRLEAELQRKDERIATLETRLETQAEQLDDHDSRLTETETDTDRLDALTQATRNRTGANKARIEDLQARELEKGAHLETTHVDATELEVQGDQLERITKDDGRTYFRIPESADPLDSGSVSLAYGDLLPLQQLARMDEEMRRSTANALPTRLAATLWQARTDASVGDNPWESGCKNVDEFVAASDLKHWIRRQEPGTSETYAKKLVSRTIDALLDLSQNRLAVRRTTERKNGLEYTERRVILPADAAIPGETGQADGRTTAEPETADVHS